MDLKTDESKSAAYHKMVHSKCGDDNVQCGNKQNIIRVDPCLKLFKGGKAGWFHKKREGVNYRV